MLNLSTHQLNIFLAAAETLNFTQAAQQLQITQPSVSQHIQALEEHFGLPLFARSGRNIDLTEAGVVLAPLAREMVYLANHIEETMLSLKGNVFGHLVIGCSTATGRYLLPRLLAGFHHLFPQVRATCHVTHQAEVLAMLAQGKVHLAMASNPPLCQDVEFHPLGTENTILITPLDHPWAREGEIDVSRLTESAFILPVEGSETHSTIREGLARLGASIYALPTLISLGSLEAIALSVEEGLGVAFVPELVVSRLVAGRVARVAVCGLSIFREVFVARHIRRPATAAQTAFWDYLINPQNPVLHALEFRSVAMS